MYTISFIATYVIIGVICTAFVYFWGLVDSDIYKYSKKLENRGDYARSVIFTPATIVWAMSECVSKKLDEMV